MKYFVAKTEEINPNISSPQWEKAQWGYVDNQPWAEGLFPAPKTSFKLLRGPEGLSVLMHTDEKNLRAEIEEENGMVCTDSCMEFFYKPSPWDARYLNFEINPKGVMHIGLGDGRFGRVLIEDRAELDIVSVAEDGNWTVKYYIPDSFINKYFPDLEELSRGNVSKIAKANFYKCADETDRPHLACWSMIDAQFGDFHIADFFGQLVF